MKHGFLLAVFAAILGNMPAAPASLVYTFATDPVSGDIQGAAGATIGWGYSITNEDSTHWLVPTDLAADPIPNSTPDASVFDFPVIAPNTTASLVFDPVAGTGLYGLTWDSTAPIGFFATGNFTLDAQWWTGDPSSGGSFFQDAAEETAAFQATVSAPVVSGVPEPRSGALLLLGCLALARLIRRRMQRAR